MISNYQNSIIAAFVNYTCTSVYGSTGCSLVNDRLFLTAALEFVYAQSPHNMRAMMVGLFFWVDGISSTVAALVLFAFSYGPKQTYKLYFQMSHQSCGFWYYCVLFVLGIVTFILYVFLAKCYRNRTRGDLDTERYYRLS